MNESPPSNQNLHSNLYCDCIYVFIEILYFFVQQSHIRVEFNEVLSDFCQQWLVKEMSSVQHLGLVIFYLPSAVPFCCVVHSLRSRLSPFRLIPSCPIFVAQEIRISSPLLLHTSCWTIYFHFSLMSHVKLSLHSCLLVHCLERTRTFFFFLHKSCSNQVAMGTVHLQLYVMQQLLPSNTETFPDLHLNIRFVELFP